MGWNTKPDGQYADTLSHSTIRCNTYMASVLSHRGILTVIWPCAHMAAAIHTTNQTYVPLSPSTKYYLVKFGYHAITQIQALLLKDIQPEFISLQTVKHIFLHYLGQ